MSGPKKRFREAVEGLGFGLCSDMQNENSICGGREDPGLAVVATGGLNVVQADAAGKGSWFAAMVWAGTQTLQGILFPCHVKLLGCVGQTQRRGCRVGSMSLASLGTFSRSRGKCTCSLSDIECLMLFSVFHPLPRP